MSSFFNYCKSLLSVKLLLFVLTFGLDTKSNKKVKKNLNPAFVVCRTTKAFRGPTKSAITLAPRNFSPHRTVLQSKYANLINLYNLINSRILFFTIYFYRTTEIANIIKTKNR